MCIRPSLCCHSAGCILDPNLYLWFCHSLSHHQLQSNDCRFLCASDNLCSDMVIADCLRRAFQQIDITKNTAHPELILIFQVRAIAPLQIQDGKGIPTLPDLCRHIELTHSMCYLTVSYIHTVQPHIEAAVHSFKIQKYFRRLLLLLIIKRVHICPTRHILRYIRRIKWKRIPDIRILMGIIACHLPGTRHRNLIKSGAIIFHVVKFFIYIINALKIPESPVTV